MDACSCARARLVISSKVGVYRYASSNKIDFAEDCSAHPAAWKIYSRPCLACKRPVCFFQGVAILKYSADALAFLSARIESTLVVYIDVFARVSDLVRSGYCGNFLLEGQHFWGLHACQIH